MMLDMFILRLSATKAETAGLLRSKAIFNLHLSPPRKLAIQICD